jgi:UDP-N-acetylmuramate--alanine ligase
VVINLAGDHNVLNALAAIAVATEEGVSDAAILAGLKAFSGVGRRFDVADGIRFAGKQITVVDDYGHHPTEVAMVIEAARKVWPDRRLVMTYQPHRYTRTHDLYDDFTKVLSTVDKLVLLEVYAAGEDPIAGADSHALCQGIRERGSLNPIYAANPAEAFDLLPNILENGDVLLVQGAGNVNQLSNRLRGDNEGH